MKQFVIIAAMMFASMTITAQNGNSTIALNNTNETKEQTTTKEAEAQKKIEAKEKQEEVSIFDNSILNADVVAKANKNKEDK